MGLFTIFTMNCMGIYAQRFFWSHLTEFSFSGLGKLPMNHSPAGGQFRDFS